MKDYLRRWICGWFTLAESLVAILTLGVISPSWGFNYLVWNMKRTNKKFLEEQKKNGKS